MKHLAAMLLCSLSLGATAQPVYRCGNEYSQTPCPQGRVVDAADPRTAKQRADGLRVAANEQRRVADLQRELFAEPAAQRPVATSGHRTKPVPAMNIASSDAPHPPKKKRTAADFSPNGPVLGAAPAVQHKGSGKR
jgi:hypothetical protein